MCCSRMVVRKTKVVNKRLFLELLFYAGDQQQMDILICDVILGSAER